MSSLNSFCSGRSHFLAWFDAIEYHLRSDMPLSCPPRPGHQTFSKVAPPSGIHVDVGVCELKSIAHLYASRICRVSRIKSLQMNRIDIMHQQNGSWEKNDFQGLSQPFSCGVCSVLESSNSMGHMIGMLGILSSHPVSSMHSFLSVLPQSEVKFFSYRNINHLHTSKFFRMPQPRFFRRAWKKTTWNKWSAQTNQ